jgi:hypothetical protein
MGMRKLLIVLASAAVLTLTGLAATVGLPSWGETEHSNRPGLPVYTPVTTAPAAPDSMHLIIAAAGLIVPVVRIDAGDLPGERGSAGWWASSAMPGDDSGTTVIAAEGSPGHGPLAALHGLPAGTVVELRVLGQAVRYLIGGRTSYPPGTSPPSSFDLAGPHRLVLLGCLAGSGCRGALVVEAKPLGLSIY